MPDSDRAISPGVTRGGKNDSERFRAYPLLGDPGVETICRLFELTPRSIS